MRRKPNKKLIGLFLLVSFILFIGIIANFILEKNIADRKNLVVMYFDESVAGLSVGAPVVFMGVEIGKVVKVDLIANPETMNFSIPVFAKIEPRKNVKMNNFKNRSSVLAELIKKGLRARLATQSFLTGQLMIELIMLPDSDLNYERHSTHLFEIPTVLSQFGQISKGIEDLPIQESVLRFNMLLEKMDKQILPDINTLTTNLNKLISTNSKETTRAIYNFNQTLNDIGSAAKSMRNLTDYLERHPESLLRGKKGN